MRGVRALADIERGVAVGVFARLGSVYFPPSGCRVALVRQRAHWDFHESGVSQILETVGKRNLHGFRQQMRARRRAESLRGYIEAFQYVQYLDDCRAARTGGRDRYDVVSSVCAAHRLSEVYAVVLEVLARDDALVIAHVGGYHLADAPVVERVRSLGGDGFQRLGVVRSDDGLPDRKAACHPAERPPRSRGTAQGRLD